MKICPFGFDFVLKGVCLTIRGVNSVSPTIVLSNARSPSPVVRFTFSNCKSVIAMSAARDISYPILLVVYARPFRKTGEHACAHDHKLGHYTTCSLVRSSLGKGEEMSATQATKHFKSISLAWKQALVVGATAKRAFFVPGPSLIPRDFAHGLCSCCW